MKIKALNSDDLATFYFLFYLIYLMVFATGNEEAVRAYTMIDPIQQMLDDIEELMKYRNYQPAIDKITEVIEV